MTTLREKIETKWAEGLEAARHLIRAKVGENAVLGEPSSVYHYDLRREARGLEVQLDVIRDDVREFLSKAASGPSPAEREAQRQMDLDDANAAAIAREKAAAKAASNEEAKPEAPTPEEIEEELERFLALDIDEAGEWEKLEGLIAEELDRLGASDSDVDVRWLEGGFWASIALDDRVIRISTETALALLRGIKEEDPTPTDAAHVVAEALAAVAPPDPPRVPALDGDPELEACEAELGKELDRVLGDARTLVHAHAEWDDTILASDGSRVIAVDVGADGSDAEGTAAWGVYREAVRVLGALRQLPDGAGVEAVRAILCGLAETPKAMPTDEDVVRITEAIGGIVPGAPDVLAETDPSSVFGDPKPTRDFEQDIGAELTRCGADGVEATVGLSSVKGDYEAFLGGWDWSHRDHPVEVLDALRLLPDDCGEAAVKARLLYGKGLPEADPGRPADPPRKAPAKKRKTRAERDADDVVVGGEK